MFTGAGNGHAVQHFKKVKVKRLQQRGRSSFVLFLLVPLVELLLCASENFIYSALYAEFFIDKVRVPLLSKFTLVAKIGQTVVDLGSRKHQNLLLYARAYNTVHQTKVAILAAVFSIYFTAVSEVM